MADDGTLTKDEIDEIAGKVGNLNTKNPYRVVYNMVLGATVKTAIGAKNFFTGDVVYNPATNPNGMVFRIACSFMDDVEFTRSAQTDDEMEFCDEQQRQTVTGYEYSFSGREKIDRDLKAFTAANMLRRLTWAPDRRYILIDRVRYQGGPASRFQTDDWCRLYDFSTDVPNYTVGNGEKVTIDFQPIASGNTWDVDLVLQDMAVSVDVPAYAEGESFMANENVDWAIGPRGSISTPKAPKASEINALTNIVGLVPFPDVTFPHATSSESESRPTIAQNANASSRSTGNYEGSIQVFYPQEALTQTSNPQVALTNLIRSANEQIDSVTRISQSPEGDRQPVKPGDIVGVQYFKTSMASVPQDGTNAYVTTTDFLQDGLCVVDAIVTGDTVDEPVVLVAAGGATSVAAGEPLALFAELYGHDVTYCADYEVTAGSDFATVSNRGVLTATKGGGSVTVKCSHPSGLDATLTLQTTATATTLAATGLSALAADTEAVVTSTGHTGTRNIKAVTVGGRVVDWFSPVDADGALDATALTLRVPALAAGTYDLVADLYDGASVTIQVEYV